MQLCIFVIVKQYLIIGVTALCHYSSTDLAKTYTMPPPCTIKDDATGDTVVDITQFNREGGTVKVAIGKSATDFEFLTTHQLLLTAHDAQFLDTPTGAALYGLEVENITKVFFATLSKETRQFCLRKFHLPAVEVLRLTVVIVEHLRKEVRILRITEGVRGSVNPAVEVKVVSAYGLLIHLHIRRHIVHGVEIREFLILPTSGIALCDTATTL